MLSGKVLVIMQQFYKKVDRRSRKAMTAFLAEHFRYSTMNSWNGSTSYACNLKVHRLGLDSEVVDKLFELVQTEEFHDHLRELTRQFGEEHDYTWQARFNGSNGGYLVLYQGETKQSQHKSFCRKCGQRNFTSVNDTGTICGRCRSDSRVDYAKPLMEVVTFYGRSTDMYEEFDDWDMDALRGRVELVSEFDKLADSIVAEAVYLAENYSVVEEEYAVRQTRKVMVA